MQPSRRLSFTALGVTLYQLLLSLHMCPLIVPFLCLYYRASKDLAGLGSLADLRDVTKLAYPQELRHY